jgi:hypothetical protein
MTPTQLRAALATLLSAQLGTYKLPNGLTTPAIYVGEPPADWIATGLEVRIEPLADLDVQFVHAGEGIGLEYRVVLIPRSATHALTAIRRVVQRFDTTPPRTVPANERLGILQQYTLTIRSQ